MAPDFAVGPMPDRHHRHLIVVLGLTEPIFHDPAIQVGLNDIIDRPIHLVGNDDIFAEAVDVAADPVVIFAKI